MKVYKNTITIMKRAIKDLAKQEWWTTSNSNFGGLRDKAKPITELEWIKDNLKKELEE